MKLRTVLILATIVLGVIVLSGVVLAKTCRTTCNGDNGDNTLTGTDGNNTIHAKGGGDVVNGNRGNDYLYGEGGGDEMSGGAGRDYIDGGSGTDWLNGKKGNDRVRGMDPASYSSARKKQRKVEMLIGESGNDTFMAKDGKKDIIRGGPGSDIAYVDPIDTRKGVEVVRGTPPVATINSGPQTGVPDTDGYVEFTFSANETATFECRLKEPNVPNPAWEPCESPQPYEGDGGYGLADGTYIFELRATDTDGNTSEVASREFEVLD